MNKNEKETKPMDEAQSCECCDLDQNNSEKVTDECDCNGHKETISDNFENKEENEK